MVVLLDEDIQTLDEGLKARGWTRGEDSEALKEASRYLIELFIGEYIKSTGEVNNYDLPLEILKGWIKTGNNNKKDDSKKIYIKNENEFTKFEQSNQTQNNISSLQIDDLIDNFTIAAVGISQDSLRWCTDLNYPKRKTISKPKKMSSQVVKAYCAALDIDFNSLKCNQSSLSVGKKEELSNNQKIFITLTEFDHDHLVAHINNQLSVQPRRTSIIYIPPSHNIFRNWALHRLERVIRDISNLQVVKIVYKQEIMPDYTFISLYDHFKENKGNLRDLQNRCNYILFFESANELPSEHLDNIMNFWSELQNNINSPAVGFLIMIWLDTGNNNRWIQQKLSNPSIYQLPMSDKFTQQDFEKIFPLFKQKFQLGNNIDDTAEVNELWSSSNYGNIEKTLEAFYKKFKGQLARETQWQRYP
jgi:hypothetical protein